MIIDPRGLTAIEWTDYMADELDGYSRPPKLDDESKWQGWALTVIQSPRIAAFNPPEPFGYADWSEWAMRFNQAVTLNT